jgi:general secretion pathway protein G
MRNAHRRGFTLIELLVTLAIVGLLGALVIPTAQVTVQRRSEQELRTALYQVRKALDDYKQAYDDGRIAKTIGSNGYPKKLEELVDGVPDLRNPKRARIHFLRRMPRDPFATNSELTATETWGKRSYASEAEEPREGEDVYDIFSNSDRVGLNGIPYRKW